MSSLTSIPEHGIPQDIKNVSLPNFSHAKFLSVDYIDRHDSQGQAQIQGQGQRQPMTQWIDKPGGTIIVIERPGNQCANNQWIKNQSAQNIPGPSTATSMPSQSAIQTDMPGTTAVPMQIDSGDQLVPPVAFNFQTMTDQSVSGSSLESDGVVSMLNLAQSEQQDDFIQDVIQKDVKRSSTYTQRPQNATQQVNNWILIEKL